MIDLKAEAKEIFRRYPEGKQRSAMLPLLHRVQERDGHITADCMAEVADLIGVTTAEVQSVASFYTMFHLKPKGRHVVSVCHNIACTLAGAEKVIDALEDSLGISCGDTTPDGSVTLERAECLAHCELAPLIQFDYEAMEGPFTPPRAVARVDGLRTGDEARTAGQETVSSGQPHEGDSA